MANQLILNGKRFEVADLSISNFIDFPQYRLNMKKNGRKRNTSWVRSIVLHTTKGWPDVTHPKPQQLFPGYGSNQKAGEKCINVWKDANAGAHLIVDFDGAIYQCADLLTEVTYHATIVNEVSVGIEIYQGSKAELYEGQLEITVKLLDALTALLGIQRQYHFPYQSNSLPSRLTLSSTAGKDVVGIYGHRDMTTNRSEGDPGDLVFQQLQKAGYEAFDFSKNEDIGVWKKRQEQLKIAPDGIPGPHTVKSLIQQGYADGLWIKR